MHALPACTPAPFSLSARSRAVCCLSPSNGRYLVHILLQLLPHTPLQPLVVDLLGDVVGALLQPPPEETMRATSTDTWPVLTSEVC